MALDVQLNPQRRNSPAGIAGDPAAQAAGRPLAEALKVHVLRDGTVVEIDDPDELAKLIAEGSTRLWIDLTDPSPAAAEEGARCVGLHPVVAGGVLWGQ